MKDMDFLQQYMDAAKESSTRTRQILLVMILASILVFAAYWNSRQDAWINSRLALANAVIAIQDKEKAQKEAAQKHEILTDNEELKNSLGETGYEEAEKLAHTRTPSQAWAAVQWLQKIRAEQVSQFQVPALGISFDVNDLGMLGGFAFMVLLIWVNYSLWHHSTNLKLAFDFARELEENGEPRLRYYTYQNLAMRQVLTIPPKPASIRTSEKDKFINWVQKVSKSLYALPLVVQAVVVAHDWNTLSVGMQTNAKDTKIVLTMGTLLGCLVLILTVICFVIWSKTYKTWKTVADEI